MDDSQASAYSADAPIGSIAEDKLGRAPFARRIAEAIDSWRGNESLVIGVLGDWGCGKTSVLNMATEHLATLSDGRAADEKPITVHFNPWNFSQQNQLLRAFFATLRDVLDEPDMSQPLKDAAKRLDRYARVLGPAEFAFDLFQLPGRGFLSRFRGKVVRVGEEAAKLAQALESDVETLKAQIGQNLRDGGRQIVVVIDDIDRLMNDEIRQLFQLVKLNADFPRTVYMLAFDAHRVGEALESTYGSDFVEKIVQVPLSVPNVSRGRIRELLFGEISGVLTRNGVDWEQPDNTEFNVLFGSAPYLFFRSVRHVRRYANAVEFTFPLVKGEVNHAEFIILEMFRILRPSVHAALYNQRDFLTRVPDGRDAATGAALDALRTECGEHWGVVAKLLKEMFPAIAVEQGSAGYGTDWRNQWAKERRARHPQYFDRYFLLTVPEDAVSVADFAAIWNDVGTEDKLREHLRNLNEQKLFQVFEMMRGHAEVAPHDARRSSALALLGAGDVLRSRHTRPLESDPNLYMRLVVQQLLEPLNADERFDIVREAAEVGDLGSVAAYVHERDADAEQSRRERSFTDEQLAQLKSILIGRIEEEGGRGSLIQSPHFSLLFFLWLRWTDADGGACDFINAAVRDDVMLPVTLDVFAREGWTAQGYREYRTWHPMRDAIECIGIDVLRERMKSLNGQYVSRLDDRQREIVAYLSNLTQENIADDQP